MVQYARFQRTIVDDAGNILPGAKVEVRSEATGSLATLYSDRNGTVGLSNPVTADADGFAYFHVTGGAYKIRAYTGSSGSPTYEKIWRYEGIGRGSEGDSMDGVSSGTTRTLNLGGSPLDTTTDPGVGGLTFNNATMASVTEIAIDVLNLGGGNESDWLAALGTGASTNKSRLEIRNAADPLVDFAIFDVTASAVQGSPPTFYRLTVTHVASGGTLADNQTVNITSAPAGSKGDLGSDGTDPGVLLNWDTGTSDADPGSGDIRADNASLAAATFLYVSLTNRSGDDITTFLSNLGRSTNTVRLGEVILTRPSDDTQAIFDLDSVAADGSPATYYKLGISNHSGATSFDAADAISFQFTADGNSGSDGAGLVDSVNGYTGAVTLNSADVGSLAGVTVRCATTAEIDIATALNTNTSPAPTIDGVTLTSGDYVLVKDQGGGSPDLSHQNGIYEAGGSPARLGTFDDYDEHPGALVTVQEGTTNADTVWQCTSNTGGTLDTTAIAFERFVQPPKGHIFGLTLSNGTDATNDIDIATGEAVSQLGHMMRLESGLTKRLDAAFSAGDAAGGRFEASISNATWHVFLISNGTAVDVGFSTSLDPTSDPNYPSGYTHYRRIFSILRESGSIRGFSQLGDDVLWDDSVRDINDSNPGTSADLRSLTVPTGIQVEANISVQADNSSVNLYLMVSSPDTDDNAASATNHVARHHPVASDSASLAFSAFVRTDTSGRIRTRCSASGAGTDLMVHTHGYRDARGRYA